jgi:hypothetical protein
MEDVVRQGMVPYMARPGFSLTDMEYVSLEGKTYFLDKTYGGHPIAFPTTCICCQTIQRVSYYPFGVRVLPGMFTPVRGFICDACKSLCRTWAKCGFVQAVERGLYAHITNDPLNHFAKTYKQWFEKINVTQDPGLSTFKRWWFKERFTACLRNDAKMKLFHDVFISFFPVPCPLNCEFCGGLAGLKYFTPYIFRWILYKN